MTSPDPIPTTLSDQLRQLGLVHTANELNDFVARATQKRWSPVVQRERLAHAELEARLRQRVERRLRDGPPRPLQANGRLGMGLAEDDPSADGRARPLPRLFAQRENVIRCRARTRQDHDREKPGPRSDLGRPLGSLPHRRRSHPRSHPPRDRARALQHRLRSYLRPSLLAIDEVGYLAYADAADLLFQVVSRRYEQKSIVITTNLPFKLSNGTRSFRTPRAPSP